VTPLAHLLEPCLLILTIGYLGTCAVSPWKTCPRCHGNSRRYCRRCDGTGKRPRAAWRIAAYLIRSWRDSNR
jgi:DnaJ-class molecular chaperone